MVLDRITTRMPSCRAEVCVADIRGAAPWAAALIALGWTPHVVAIRDWITGHHQGHSSVDARLIDIRPLRDHRLQRLVAERVSATGTPTVLLGDAAHDQDLARRLRAIALLPPTFALDELDRALDQARALAPRPWRSSGSALPRC